MQRNIIILIVLLIIAGGLIFFINKTEAPVVETTDQATDTEAWKGAVTGVNLDDMALDGPALISFVDQDGVERTVAVPSMGIQLCDAREEISSVSNVAVGDLIDVSGSLDEEGRIVPCMGASDYLSVTSYMRDAVYGFEFPYRKGPDGYITLEDIESTDPDFVTGIQLINEMDYYDLLGSSEPREAPPSLHVRVYRNDGKMFSGIWAQEHPIETNIELATSEPEEAAVGGANAVHYVTDGLYPTDTYVVAHGEHVYVLMGGYLDESSAEYQDFQSLVASFTFIAPPGAGAPQAKINIQAVCEGALAYMTFPDSDAADAFIAECIDGNHPEVIDRYIESLNLDGAAI